jgi:hypothetical protein
MARIVIRAERRGVNGMARTEIHAELRSVEAINVLVKLRGNILLTFSPISSTLAVKEVLRCPALLCIC